MRVFDMGPNDWRANNAALVTLAGLCRDDSQGVHLPPISDPSNPVTHPFLDASDWIIIWGVDCSLLVLT